MAGIPSNNINLLSAAFGLMIIFIGCSSQEGSNTVNGFIFDATSLDESDVDQTIDLGVRVDGMLNSSISVTYEMKDNTAKAGTDYVKSGGTIVFSPGSEQANLPLQLIGDTAFELPEDFDILLTYEGQVITYEIAIVDNDTIPAALEDQDGFYTPAEYVSMTKVWSDEFDGTALDMNNWTYELGDGCDAGLCGWGNNELENYTSDATNLSLANGMMTITATEQGGVFNSARIITKGKHEFTFGRIDIRAKLPEGQGIWPAIWMLGANIDQVGWPASGEIDIMELIGNLPSTVHGTVHYDDGGYKTTTGASSLDFQKFSDKFHVFSIVWTKDKITWYVDNKSYKSFSRSDNGGYPFNSPFFFIMNVAVGGNWPGSPDSTTVFPQKMIVDYVRVFQ